MSRNPGKNRKSNENRDEVLIGIDTANISASDTLENYYAAFAAGITSIMLIPADSTDDIYMTFSGTASASTAHLPKTGVVIPVTKAVADDIELFHASGADVTLMIYGPRT
jgi:hypothetical protein